MPTLSAGYDFLGKLGNDLRDLSGLDTLIFELIQNADDASRATEMRFDVTPDALIVCNDGSFSDCLEQESTDCPGVANEEGELVRCDFHSLRRISGQAKRDKSGTTGAFGIGFTSVFQITDYPELISSGRHWRMRYDESENDRIEICEGCEHDHAAPGTTFILPWAFSSDSAVRQGLRARAVAPGVGADFIAAAADAIEPAMVFLRRLRRIEVTRDGVRQMLVVRSDEGTLRMLDTGTARQTFLMLDGAFDDAAAELRKIHPSVLGEDVREAEVSIAIPLDEPNRRLALHAVLPTRETTHLGLRLSSSFYPFQDRKRLKFGAEGDPESDWNRAAVRAGARILAAAVKWLPDELDAKRLWSLIASVHDVADSVDDAPDPVFASFWGELCAHMAEEEVVWSADDRWLPPGKVFLLEPDWRPALDALHELGLAIVNPLIHDHVAAVAEDIGVGSLTASDLATAIKQTGLTSERQHDALPGCLATRPGLDALLRVVADMIGRWQFSPDTPIRAFDGCAIVPCLGGTVAPPDQISLELEGTVALFGQLPGLTFVDVDHVDRLDERLRRVLRRLMGWEVVDALAQAREQGTLTAAIAGSAGRHMLRWLADRAADLDAAHVQALRGLPIFPSARGLVPLTELELPGPFDSDPLEITETVDLRDIDDLREFLGKGCLGARTLDLDVYINDRLVPASAEGRTFEDDKLDRLLAMLADKLDDLDDAALDALAELPLIPTRGDGRLAATSAYFDTEIVRTVLGAEAIVALPERQLRKLKPLLEELGVEDEPRPQDVAEAVEAIVAQPKTPERSARVRTIVEHLGPKFRFGTDAEQESKRSELNATYPTLLELEWLPSSRGGWALPGELHRTDWRTAFETTGNFIELTERTVQQPNADFLELLGVRLRPDPALVIDHLLASVEAAQPVRKRVYEALNELATAADLEPLQDRPCILMSADPVQYAPPTEVVRNPGALRNHLYALPKDLVGYHELTAALDIPEEPTESNAALVLQRISSSSSGPVTVDDRAAIQQCWRILEREWELVSDEAKPGDLEELEQWIEAELSHERCWLDRAGVPSLPRMLFIDDLPALRRFVPDDVQAMLVDRPRMGVQALKAAGLRFLSQAVAEEIESVPNTRPNPALAGTLRARSDALARILSAADVSLEPLDDLPSLELFVADEIVVRRSIVDPELDLGEQSVAALLDKEGGRLFVSESSPMATTGLAVELARFLCGEGFNPGIASSIEMVLSAASVSAAHDALDALQIARLGEDVEDGGDSATDETSPFEHEEDWDEHACAEPELDSDAPEASMYEDGADEEELDEEELDEEELDEETAATVGEEIDEEDDLDSGFTPEPGHVGGSGRNGDTGDRGSRPGYGGSQNGTRTSSAEHAGSTNGRSNGASGDPDQHPGTDPTPPEVPWRIWVSGQKGGRQDRVAESPATKHLRDSVAERGVERVIQYERDHGRIAVPMPPNNEGYDVESVKGPGKPVQRRIEVKALGGTWEAEWGTAGNPPQMTGPQFRMSIEDGRHWLYVVENALDDDRWSVYPIQNVGQKANRYLIDHGWKEAADRPAGPGYGRPEKVSQPPSPLSDLSGILFGRDDRDVGDVPFLSWNELGMVGRSDLDEKSDTWFTSPVEVSDGDFAVQQLEDAMGPTLPRGAIAVFRPVTGEFANGSVVLADVSAEDADPAYEIRRVHLVRDETGELERLLLNVDVPGRGEEHEFADQCAAMRVVAMLVGHQPV
jgi:hypothetical protein